jgi:hypothetical protein
LGILRSEKTEERKVFHNVVANRDAFTLRSTILKYVRRGSIIATDFWKGYLGLDELGYTHLGVNHSESFVYADSGACTNSIRGTWSGLKRKIPVRNRTANIEDNLWEFIYRRRHNSDLWCGFLESLDKFEYE